MIRTGWLTGCLVAGLATIWLGATAAEPQFELVQPELFAATGGQPNCWADYDGDGDLDLFVGFREGVANKLYRNDNGTFVEVGAEMGVADLNDTRAASWGDFDGDGNIDLFVGFTRKSTIPSKLYRNQGAGKPFVDVAKAMGIDAPGETRQSSFIDFDNDGDLDFFVGLRDAPNLLFRNDGKMFTNVGKDLGIDDPRRTVGAVWFDLDQDGDLDVFIGNQNGDLNGLVPQRPHALRGRREGTRDGRRRPSADVRQQWPQRCRLRQRWRSRSVRGRIRR